MKKYFDIGVRVVLSLILVMPVLGVLGIFPAPTADMYNTPQAFQFITMLSELGFYINYTIGIVAVLALIALWTGRVALGAILILPVTVNVIGFHLFLDGGLLTMGALLGNIMALINLYLIWVYRSAYQPLLRSV